MTERKQFWIAAVSLVLLVLALYAASLQNDFVYWDDSLLIKENPIVRGLTWQNVKAAFSRYDPELYIPLTFLSYQATYMLSELDPFLYHLGNIFLHALNVILVLVLVYKLRRSRTEALVCAALFAIHPLHTEAVAWASGRKDLLSAFFFLLSVLTYLKYAPHPNPLPKGEGRYYWLSIFLFLLGLLSKVGILMLPAVLLLIDWLEGRVINARVLREKIPYLVLSIAFAGIAIFGKVTSASFYWEKFLLGCKAAIFYLAKLLVPVHLSVLYPYTQPISLASTDLLLSVVAVLGISALTIFSRRRFRLGFFAWWWYVLMVLPTFTTIAKGHNTSLDVYFASDRYAYLPSIGILLLIAAAWQYTWRKAQAVALALLAFVMLIFVMLTGRQSLVWKNTESLFRRVIASYPDSHVAHTQLGVVLFNRDDIEGAFAEFQNAVAIRPDGTAYYDIGQIYLRKGMIDEAMEAYRRAISANPLDPDPYSNLGALLIRQGKDKEAIEVLEQAKDLKPDVRLFINLGLAYEHLGRKKDAIETYKRALELDPENEEIRQSLRQLSE